MGCGFEKLVDSLVVVLCQAVVLCWLVGLVGYDVEGLRRVFLTPRNQARGAGGRPAYSSPVEGGLCREARRGVPYHHGAAPREVGSSSSSSAATATASATAEVEVVKETLAPPDGVWALLRWQCEPIIRTRDIVREIRAQGARGWHGRSGGPLYGSPIDGTSNRDRIAPEAIIDSCLLAHK